MSAALFIAVTSFTASWTRGRISFSNGKSAFIGDYATTGDSGIRYRTRAGC
jgi:hypothetical protein